MDKGPPPSYQSEQPPTHVIFTQPTVPPMGSMPTRVTCPSCRAQITTHIRIENSTKTHLIALILCLIFFPCACVPYCTDSCRAKNHYCPYCQAFLGSYDS